MVPPLTDVEHFTRPPPRIPVRCDSPPQKSGSWGHDPPPAGPPCAGGETAIPVGQSGAHRARQPPPAQPTWAGSQRVPSTPLQFTPPADGGRPHVPGFVAD